MNLVPLITPLMNLIPMSISLAEEEKRAYVTMAQSFSEGKERKMKKKELARMVLDQKEEIKNLRESVREHLSLLHIVSEKARVPVCSRCQHVEIFYYWTGPSSYRCSLTNHPTEKLHTCPKFEEPKVDIRKPKQKKRGQK